MVKTDLVRLDSLLPELSPRDRGGELVEHTVRQHVSLCFSALERRLLGSAEALQGALEGPAGRHNGEAKQRVLTAGLAGMQWLCCCIFAPAGKDPPCLSSSLPARAVCLCSRQAWNAVPPFTWPPAFSAPGCLPPPLQPEGV